MSHMMNPDPMRQFEQWYKEAVDAQVPYADAMTLATVTVGGHPDARVVLLKGLGKTTDNQESLMFFTNYESLKGQQLEKKTWATLVFFWPQLEKQVRIEGNVEKCNRSASEEYFRTRPRESQIGAWVSKQSAVIPNRVILEEAFNKITKEYEGRDVPCPKYWGGYHVIPTKFEFWISRPHRLHDRFQYVRDSRGQWQMLRLSP